ncbi:MAG: branched-chain amino acid transport system ATP-binding protein [Solirubrobacteraceae bacterium]|nr:branched-chain amino acid transport system ATP-binding protein [Solirubrobacteraceae bacterium]
MAEHEAVVEARPHTVDGVSLRATGLSAGYDGRPVINDISISVAPAEVVSIVGPNGSGKSTLLKSLVGVVGVLEGKVLVGEQDVTGWRSENIARIGVGYVPQTDDVFAPLTVRENLEMGGYLLRTREVPARIEHVLSVFPQLAKMQSRRAGKLSGGERKMLAMGRVLMLEPRLVVLDEPTANLAPIVALAVLQEHVRQLARTGASVLIVEQRARAVHEISDRTYVLSGGRLRMEGTPAQLSDSPEFVDSFLGGSAPPRRA